MAAVDPHDDLGVPRQRPRLVVGEVLGQRELPVRLLDQRQLPLILGRCDDGGVLGPALLRLADVGDDHPFGLHVELLQVVLELRVVDEPVVIPDGESELILWRRHLRRRRRPILRLRHGNRQAREEKNGRRAGLQGSSHVEHGNLVVWKRTTAGS
jgi:hypothetical protein